MSNDTSGYAIIFLSCIDTNQCARKAAILLHSLPRSLHPDSRAFTSSSVCTVRLEWAMSVKWPDTMWCCRCVFHLACIGPWIPKLTSWQEAPKGKFNLQNGPSEIHSWPQRRHTHGYENYTPLVSAAELPLPHKFYYICSAWSLKIFAVALLSLHGRQTSKWIIFIHMGQTYFQLRVSENCSESFRRNLTPTDFRSVNIFFLSCGFVWCHWFSW